MNLVSDSFKDKHPIPAEFAFCAPDPDQYVTSSSNRNPQFSWSDLPTGTKSFVLICHDPDVPSKPDDVNQEGRVIPTDLPRIDFYHWVLVDIPADKTSIAAAEFSNGVTANGKNGPNVDQDKNNDMRQGVNDYTIWFQSDAEMGGDYFGYDGPCPPWNDSIVHHYIFTLYALDREKCPIEGRFTGGEVLDAIKGHTLATASVTGLYSQNPDVPVK